MANFKATGTMYELHIPKKIGAGMSEIEQEEVRAVLDEAFTVEYPKISLHYHC